MSDDNGLKSSLELAMERFKKQDAKAGVTARPVSDEHKAAIAELRSFYDSKIAEQEILQQSALSRLVGGDRAELDEVSRQFRRERERFASERDAKVEAIRNQTVD
ncbi:MAG: hypothetical protein HQ485_05315 [Acidobacteria bacterium]|nr:hypothetical protein [Acidobacteriota bacterium]